MILHHGWDQSGRVETQFSTLHIREHGSPVIGRTMVGEPTPATRYAQLRWAPNHADAGGPDVDNPAAWHPDPVGRHEYRWWDGSQWTEHVADGGVAAVDPLDSAAPAQTDTDATAPQGSTDGTGQADGSAGTTGDTGADAAGSSAWSQPGGDGATPGSSESFAQQPAAQDPAAQQPQSGYQQPQQPQPAHQQPQQPYQQPQQPYQQQPAEQAGAWPAAGGQQAATAPQSNGIAVAALVIGIIALLIAWIPFIGLLGGLGGALALIFGFIGRSKVKKEGASGKGAATAGIVLGAISLVLSIIATAAIFVFGQQLFGDTIGSFEECLEETDGDTEFCERQLEEDLFDRFGVPSN